MKTILTSAAFAVFISSAAFARVVVVSPTVQLHEAKIPQEHRAARLDSLTPGAASCSTKYVTTTRVDGSSATRKSVNCEE
jgi:hypothetical protein